MILSLTIAFIVYTNMNANTIDINLATEIFLGVIFGLVAIEITGIIFWMCKFKDHLVNYVEELNRDVLAQKGIEFYYNDAVCCGKNTLKLGIRRCEMTSPFKSTF